MGLKNLRNVIERKKIGEVLLEQQMITPENLTLALQKSKETNRRLGEVLISDGFLNEGEMAKVLSIQFGLPYVNLDEIVPSPEALKFLPEQVAVQYNVLPLDVQDTTLTVALDDPLNINQINALQTIMNKTFQIVVGSRTQIKEAVERFYSGIGKRAESNVHQIQSKGASIAEEPEEIESLGDKDESVETLLNRLVERALRHRASDIHIEPNRELIRIRERVDGVLTESGVIDPEVFPLILSRIKILGGLDIAEKRKPQDGHFQMTMGSRVIDFRLSTLPTMFGEKAVIRILDRSTQKVKLEELGVNKKIHQQLVNLLNKPHGMILVTGPTGSGKTTTVYAMLRSINDMKRNIVTIEDPIENQIDIINQVQTNPKAGVTFASALRSILRQDPDVILVGEIRDTETADIAIRSALTGHLVISTLHTNDAIGTIHRLGDMGIEKFLISSSLLGVVSQRLVRRLCPKCKKPKTITEAERALLGENLVPAGTQIFEPVGCASCKNTGFRGREGIFEVLTLDHESKKVIQDLKEGDEVKLIQAGKLSTLRVNGVEKLLAGLTTVDEVLTASN